MAVGIKDVAKFAGVSPTTVSRVINPGFHPVNSETKKKVEEAIRKLDFKPNQLARALKSERSQLIGILVGDGSDPYFATIIRGISHVAQKSGYITIVCNTDRIPSVEYNFFQVLRDYNADGIIVAGGGILEPEYKALIQKIVKSLNDHGTPVLALSQQYLDIPKIRIDDLEAACQMTEYLISCGHHNIGFVNGPSNLITSQVRLDGYKKGLEKWRIPFKSSLVAEGDFTFKSGEDAVKYFLSLEHRPTAIFASNDQEAIGCINQLRHMGIRVPEDISVAGFDDIEYAQHIFPPLTTVHVPMEEMGELGMSQMIKTINTNEPIQPVTIMPHKIAIRASVIKQTGL